MATDRTQTPVITGAQWWPGDRELAERHGLAPQSQRFGDLVVVWDNGASFVMPYAPIELAEMVRAKIPDGLQVKPVVCEELYGESGTVPGSWVAGDISAAVVNEDNL